jgi:hypothetical protein
MRFSRKQQALREKALLVIPENTEDKQKLLDELFPSRISSKKMDVRYTALLLFISPDVIKDVLSENLSAIQMRWRLDAIARYNLPSDVVKRILPDNMSERCMGHRVMALASGISAEDIETVFVG